MTSTISIYRFLFPSFQKKSYDILALFISLVLITLGSFHYPGNNLGYYLIFSILSFSLLFNALTLKRSYFLMYTSVLLWLGLWWKSMAYYAMSVPLVESTGFFDFSPSAHDQSMILSSLGIFSVLAALKCYKYFQLSSLLINKSLLKEKPIFPKFNYAYFWLAFYLLILIVSVTNFYYGFQQAGIQPKTIIFPLNTVIFFMLSSGFGVIACLVIFYQLLFDKKTLPSKILISISIITLLSSSILSRATIIFHPIAILAAYFYNQKYFLPMTVFHKIKMLFFFLLIYAGSFASISMMREYFYLPAANVSQNPIAIFKQSSVVGESNKVVKAFARLLISRWVGYEGVLTAVGNKNNSLVVFFDLLTDIPKIGKADKYLIISNSGLDLTTTAKFMPTTLPGPIGFTSLSGSYFIVFSFIFFLILLFSLMEYVIFHFLENPFLCSFYAMISALNFTQIGLAPINLVKFYFILFMTLMTIEIFRRFCRNLQPSQTNR